MYRNRILCDFALKSSGFPHILYGNTWRNDVSGLLSLVLKTIADYKGNVLTIHQTIPINGVASLTLTVDILPTTGDVSSMIDQIESQPGIHYLKILASE